MTRVLRSNLTASLHDYVHFPNPRLAYLSGWIVSRQRQGDRVRYIVSASSDLGPCRRVVFAAQLLWDPYRQIWIGGGDDLPEALP